MSEEVWKDIPGFEGSYQASSFGRIKSLYRQVLRSDGVITSIRERILRPCVNKRGYHSVVLRKDGKDITREVQVLVALAFYGGRAPGDEQVRHLDGDRLNNRVENLRYGTRSQNQLDTYEYRGRHHRLTPEDVRDIRRRLEVGEKGRAIAKLYGVCESNVSAIKHGGTFAWLK